MFPLLYFGQYNSVASPSKQLGFTQEENIQNNLIMVMWGLIKFYTAFNNGETAEE